LFQKAQIENLKNKNRNYQK